MNKNWFKLLLSVYWRTLVMIIWPIVLLPILIMYSGADIRCLYILLVMAGYWVCECVPMGVVAFIPLIFFPVTGILSATKTCDAFMKSANIIFVGGLIMAGSIEYSGLNVRIALNWILLMGTSHRRLHLALSLITMLISMWIVNTAATAMMLPIIEACLLELEANGLGAMYTYPPNYNELSDAEKEEVKKPTKITINYYLTAAYASSIGGCGTLVGTGTNLAFKGLYEGDYPDEISFMAFSAFNIPPMLVSTILTYIWLEIYCMNLLRPNSEVGQLIKVAKENEHITRNVIKSKTEALGKMSFQEIMTTLIFVFAILLFIFRKLGFIPGWAELFPKDKFIKDSVSMSLVAILYFMFPEKPKFVHCCDKDESKRPSIRSLGVMTWPVSRDKVKWEMVFLLGSGFALAAGMKECGLSKLLGFYIGSLVKKVTPVLGQIIITVAAAMITELTSNVAVCNIMVPIASEVCKTLKWHPLYLMLPTAMACSFAFMLPVGTPPNTLVQPACNLPISQMMIAGLGVKVICVTSLLLFWQLLGDPIFRTSTVPAFMFQEQ